MRYNIKRRKLIRRRRLRKNDQFQKAKQIISDLLSGKKVAIIGNAESFYNKDWSEQLKEYDVIVRINAGICLTEEQKAKTTDRCDIYFDRYEGEYASKLQEVNTCEDPKLILINRPEKKNLAKLYKTTDPRVYYLTRELVAHAKNVINGEPPTMGLRVFMLLCDIGNFSELALFGFDFFETPDFYDGKTHILEDKNIIHNPKEEKAYILTKIEKDSRLKWFPSNEI